MAAGSGAHAGFADSRAIPVWLSGSLSIHADDSILLQRYLYCFLRKRQEYIHNLKKGAGVPHVYIRDLQTIPIPSPPSIEEQGRIVGRLDCREELAREIELRQKQFEYYRGKLVD